MAAESIRYPVKTPFAYCFLPAAQVISRTNACMCGTRSGIEGASRSEMHRSRFDVPVTADPLAVGWSGASRFLPAKNVPGGGIFRDELLPVSGLLLKECA